MPFRNEPWMGDVQEASFCSSFVPRASATSDTLGSVRRGCLFKLTVLWTYDVYLGPVVDVDDLGVVVPVPMDFLGFGKELCRSVPLDFGPDLLLLLTRTWHIQMPGYAMKSGQSGGNDWFLMLGKNGL